MLTDYRSTNTQKTVDIATFNFLTYIHGEIRLRDLDEAKEEIYDAIEKCKRRVEKFEEIVNGKSPIREFFSKKYRQYISLADDRVEYWEEQQENWEDSLDQFNKTYTELKTKNDLYIKYLPRNEEICAEIKCHPDLSMIFYQGEV